MPGAVNLPAQGDGTIQTTFTDDLLSLNGPNSIIVRSFETLKMNRLAFLLSLFHSTR